MNKLATGFSCLLAAGLLSACHNNPLKTNKEQQSTQFIIQASLAGAKALDSTIDEHDAPYAYMYCMKGKWALGDCNALYKAMTQFAKSTSMHAFRGVSVADLTDKEVYDTLREGYEIRLFNNDFGDLP